MAHPRQPLVDAEFDMAKKAAQHVCDRLERMRTITEDNVSSATFHCETHADDTLETHEWVIEVTLINRRETKLIVPGAINGH